MLVWMLIANCCVHTSVWVCVCATPNAYVGGLYAYEHLHRGQFLQRWTKKRADRYEIKFDSWPRGSHTPIHTDVLVIVCPRVDLMWLASKGVC